MAWRSLALSDVQTGLSAQELIGVQEYALASGQPDPTPLVIASAMDEVRGYIAASRTIQLGAEQSIPDKLIDAAISIAVWNLVKRFPTALMATDQRRMSYKDAVDQLKSVAAGKFAVEVPTVVTNEVTSGVILPQVSHLGVRARVRWEEDGI